MRQVSLYTWNIPSLVGSLFFSWVSDFFSVLLSKHGTLLSVSSMVDSCSDLAGLLLEEEQKEYKANLKR